MGFNPEAAVKMEQDDMHRYAEGFFERLAEAETLDDMEFGPEDYAFASSKIGTPIEEAPEGPPGPVQESGELTEHIAKQLKAMAGMGFLIFMMLQGRHILDTRSVSLLRAQAQIMLKRLRKSVQKDMVSRWRNKNLSSRTLIGMTL